MRLLSTVTGQFLEISDPTKIEYAILSHTWSTDTPEQTYQEIRQIQKAHGLPILTQSSFDEILPPIAKTPDGPVNSRSSSGGEPFVETPPPLVTIWDDPALSEKVKRACAVARDAGYSLLWIDSCCIDKTSSAELSEAINSMYAWYRESSICYAYLADCPAPDDPDSWGAGVEFRESRWFKRGWTLQELIAPRVVVFLSNDWQFFGTKLGLAALIATVTKIDPLVLTHKAPLKKVSVATRMSWAAKRETTRIEDRAYSLLGLFGITMPTLYGEGERAFFRLQEEILRRIPDQSIFAWGTSRFAGVDHLATQKNLFTPHPLLASSPDVFEAPPIATVPHAEFAKRLGIQDLAYPTHTFTPFGLQFQFPLVSLAEAFSEYSVAFEQDNSPGRCYLAILPCEPRNAPSALMAIVCSFSDSHVLRRLPTLTDSIYGHQTVTLSSESLSTCVRHMHFNTIFAPLERVRDSRLPELSNIDFRSTKASLELTKGSRTILEAMGYAVSLVSRGGKFRCVLEKSRVVSDKNVRLGLETTFKFDIRSKKLTVWVRPLYNSTLDGITTSDPNVTGDYSFAVPLKDEDFVRECKLRDSTGQERSLRMSVQFPRYRDNAWALDVEIAEGGIPDDPFPAATDSEIFQVAVSPKPSQQSAPPSATQSSANVTQQTVVSASSVQASVALTSTPQASERGQTPNGQPAGGSVGTVQSQMAAMNLGSQPNANGNQLSSQAPAQNASASATDQYSLMLLAYYQAIQTAQPQQTQAQQYQQTQSQQTQQQYQQYQQYQQTQPQQQQYQQTQSQQTYSLTPQQLNALQYRSTSPPASYGQNYSGSGGMYNGYNLY